MGYYICTESIFFLQSDDTNFFLNELDLLKLGQIYIKNPFKLDTNVWFMRFMPDGAGVDDVISDCPVCICSVYNLFGPRIRWLGVG